MLVYSRPHRRSFDLGMLILREPKRPQGSLLSPQLIGFHIYSLARPPTSCSCLKRGDAVDGGRPGGEGERGAGLGGPSEAEGGSQYRR
jgi:hypothetical protein